LLAGQSQPDSNVMVGAKAGSIPAGSVTVIVGLRASLPGPMPTACVVDAIAAPSGASAEVHAARTLRSGRRARVVVERCVGRIFRCDSAVVIAPRTAIDVPNERTECLRAHSASGEQRDDSPIAL